MKNLIITDRDHEFLKTLSSYGILNTRQAHQLCFSSLPKNLMHRRLRKLRRKKIIKSFEGFNRGELVWCLSRKGADIVGSMVYDVKLSKDSLGHDLLVNDLRIVLECKGAGRFWQSGYVTKQEIHKDKKNSERTSEQIPDWLFSMQTKKGAKAVAMEVEVSRKAKKRYLHILKTYAEKEKLDHIWYLVNSKTMGAFIAQGLAKLYEEKPEQWLLWSEIKDVIQNPDSFVVNHIGGHFSARKMLALTST